MSDTNVQPPASSAPPVVEVDDLKAADFFREHVRRGRPVIIRGAMQGWPALERFGDLDYLTEAAGERIASATNVETGKRSRIPLKEFWQGIFTRPDAKLAYINAIVENHGKPGVLNHLKDDVGPKPYFKPSDHKSTLIFAGRDSRSGLHYHPSTEAFLCMVLGSKRVLLFPPEQSRHVHPIPWYSKSVCFSEAVFGRDGSWPDHQRFPGFARTQPVECTLEPGDVLYIPLFWWHVVFGPGVSIGVTEMFRASLLRRFFTPMGIRSNYINGKVLRYNWHLLRGIVKRGYDG